MALYSVLSVGFILCAFGLQASIGKSEKRQKEMEVSFLMHVLLQDRIDHSDSIDSPLLSGSSTAILWLNVGESKNGIGMLTLGRFLKSYPGMTMEDVSFSLGSDMHLAFEKEYFLAARYSLNGHPYEMHIPLP